MATDIVEDFDAGLEYAEAESVLRMVQRGDQRECLVRCDAARADRGLVRVRVRVRIRVRSLQTALRI